MTEGNLVSPASTLINVGFAFRFIFLKGNNISVIERSFSDTSYVSYDTIREVG